MQLFQRNLIKKTKRKTGNSLDSAHGRRLLPQLITGEKTGVLASLYLCSSYLDGYFLVAGNCLGIMSKLPLRQEGGRSKRKAKFDQFLSLAKREENFRKIREDLHSCIEATVFRSNSKHILVIGFFFFLFCLVTSIKTELFLIHFLYKYFESYTCL